MTTNKPLPDLLYSSVDTHLDILTQNKDFIVFSSIRFYEALARTFANSGIVYTFGNGGSAADASHLTAELIGRFHLTRNPLPSVCLNDSGTALTCISNDFSSEHIFSRQVQALGRPQDLVVPFSTSGKSPNIVKSLQYTVVAGIPSFAFLGSTGGDSLKLAQDHVLVPSDSTPRIQECHTLIIHLACQLLDLTLAQ